MSSPSKKKGTQAETKVVRYFNKNGIKTERKALAGSNDEGDLRMMLVDGSELTVEVKTGQQTQNYNRTLMEKWKGQTLVESKNSGHPAILIVVRYARKFIDSEVWIPNDWYASERAGWTMMYIDEFLRELQDM
jgi:Holliday junction resolvase